MPQSRYTGINEEQVRQRKIKVIAKDEEERSAILISDDEHDVF